MPEKQHRILIFGAGVIGSTYAVKFIKAGYKVTMLARSNRLKTLREYGLQYYEKDSIQCQKVDLIEKLEPNDIYDYIFVPVKYEQAESALLALKDNQSKNIITMINNPKGYSSWENILGKGKLLPAFPSAGGYIRDGILYSQFGPKALQATMFGEINGQVTERIRTLAAIFKTANIPYSISKNMDAMQRTHAAFIVALTRHLYSSDGVREQSEVAKQETIHKISSDIKAYLSSLEKAGIHITPSKLKILQICPVWLMDFTMRHLLKTKLVTNVFFGGHTINVKEEVELMNKDYIDFLRQNNVSLKTSE